MAWNTVTTRLGVPHHVGLVKYYVVCGFTLYMNKSQGVQGLRDIFSLPNRLNSQHENTPSAFARCSVTPSWKEEEEEGLESLKNFVWLPSSSLPFALLFIFFSLSLRSICLHGPSLRIDRDVVGQIPPRINHRQQSCLTLIMEVSLLTQLIYTQNGIKFQRSGRDSAILFCLEWTAHQRNPARSRLMMIPHRSVKGICVAVATGDAFAEFLWMRSQFSSVSSLFCGTGIKPWGSESDLPCVSGHNQSKNTKNTRPITKIAKSNRNASLVPLRFFGAISSLLFLLWSHLSLRRRLYWSFKEILFGL